MSIFNTIHQPSKPQAAVSLPIDMDEWTPAMFITYHKNLVSIYGKQQARLIFNMDIQSVGYDATIFWSGAYNCDWINYAKSNNLSYYGGITSSIYCGSGDVVEGVSDAAGNVAGAVSSLSKLIIPIVIITGLILVNNRKEIKLPRWIRQQ